MLGEPRTKVKRFVVAIFEIGCALSPSWLQVVREKMRENTSLVKKARNYAESIEKTQETLDTIEDDEEELQRVTRRALSLAQAVFKLSPCSLYV